MDYLKFNKVKVYAIENLIYNLQKKIYNFVK